MADAPKKKPWIKSKLTAAARQSMPKSDFALPGKGEGPKGAGAGSYPIPDASHGRNALARVAQHGTPAEKTKVRAAVHRKFPDIGEKREGMQHATARASSRADKLYGAKAVKRS